MSLSLVYSIYRSTPWITALNFAPSSRSALLSLALRVNSPKNGRIYRIHAYIGCRSFVRCLGLSCICFCSFVWFGFCTLEIWINVKRCLLFPFPCKHTHTHLHTQAVSSINGSSFSISRVDRLHMGAYLCIGNVFARSWCCCRFIFSSRIPH